MPSGAKTCFLTYCSQVSPLTSSISCPAAMYLCTELRRKRMIPVLTRIRATSLNEFGDLVRHSGEEYVHVLEGSIVVHSEFYDPVALRAGEGIYIDSNMGHAYI